MIGDGYTTPIHCERVEALNIEPDASPTYCVNVNVCESCDVVGPETITCVGCGAQICRDCYYIEGCSLCGE